MQMHCLCNNLNVLFFGWDFCTLKGVFSEVAEDDEEISNILEDRFFDDELWNDIDILYLL